MVQLQEVGIPVVRSVKDTFPPTLTVVGTPTKFATGTAGLEHGSAEPFWVNAPVFAGSKYVFNLLFAAVPLEVQW